MQLIENLELNVATRAKSSSKKRSNKQAAAVTLTKPKIVHAQKKAPKVPASTAIYHRTTKQELVLSMLSQKSGTTIADIVAATDWQKHTVRGFFAGTVKKKMGLAITSSKAAGDVRRYRIETRRSR